MDVHIHNSRPLHYGLNDRAREDDLQFLSLEERECILFFEETIGALEEDEDERTGSSSLAPVSFASAPVDPDIIDLVHPLDEPDTAHTHTPDVPEPITVPETHSEVKTNHEPPLVTHPIPDVDPEDTKQPIINKPSVPPERRSSLESAPHPKHGPPTHAKPTRLPESISILLGSREHLPQCIAAEAVSVQERRAQTLASLTGPSHPLDGGEPACIRNLPMRSVSFRDPTPDKSRMEALSKLGLVQKRTQSVIKNPSDAKTVPQSIPLAKTNPTDNADQTKPALRSAEITHSDFNSYGGKSITLNPTLTFRAEYVSTSVPKPEPSEPHSEVDDRRRVVASPQPNYRSRSHTFTPESSGFSRKSDEDLSRRKSEMRVAPPTPSPRPRPSTRSPELRRKSLPKPAFRTQGITVQFSGRGATDEARRDALRKLGLLRDTT